MLNLFFENLFKSKSIYVVGDADLDGISGIILVLYYIKSICKNINFYITGDRGLKEFDWDIIKEYDVIIFIDIAPPSLNFYNELIYKYKKQVLIFDHHESHRKFLGELKNYFYSKNKCASKIFLDKLTTGKRVNRVVNEFIDIVNCYDCWQDNNVLWGAACELNLLKSAYIDWSNTINKTDFEKNFNFIKAMLFKFEKLKKFSYTYREIRLISSEKFKENKYYQNARKKMQIRTDNEGNSYIYFESISKLSIISNKILKEYNNIKYVIARSTYKDAVNNLNLSLRSTGNFDVKKIAEKWGGGGHLNSAGIALKNKKDYQNVIKGELHLL